LKLPVELLRGLLVGEREKENEPASGGPDKQRRGSTHLRATRSSLLENHECRLHLPLLLGDSRSLNPVLCRGFGLSFANGRQNMGELSLSLFQLAFLSSRMRVGERLSTRGRKGEKRESIPPAQGTLP